MIQHQLTMGNLAGVETRRTDGYGPPKRGPRKRSRHGESGQQGARTGRQHLHATAEDLHPCDGLIKGGLAWSHVLHDMEHPRAPDRMRRGLRPECHIQTTREHEAEPDASSRRRAASGLGHSTPQAAADYAGQQMPELMSLH